MGEKPTATDETTAQRLDATRSTDDEAVTPTSSGGPQAHEAAHTPQQRVGVRGWDPVKKEEVGGIAIDEPGMPRSRGGSQGTVEPAAEDPAPARPGDPGPAEPSAYDLSGRPGTRYNWLRSGEGAGAGEQPEQAEGSEATERPGPAHPGGLGPAEPGGPGPARPGGGS